VKDDDLEDTLNKKGYLVITELDKELTNLAENKESTFGKLTVTANDATGRISTLSGDVDKLSGDYTTLSGKYTTLDNKVTNMPATVVGVMKDNPDSPYYIGNWTSKTDGKLVVVTSGNVSKHQDDNRQPIFMTKDTLGTGIDNLLKDTSVKTGLHTLASNVSVLDSRVQGINSTVGTLQSDVRGLNTDLTTLSGNAVTVDNLGDKLQGNPKFTALSNGVNTLNSTAVTKSSLAQDLYNKLNKDPGGMCDPNADSLKSLLNGTLETCSK
jgi:outer membrane murein-binding lipoprotein Lpp